MASKLPEEESSASDSSSGNISSDEWMELCKSDYAKVIFCDLFENVEANVVGCKFQITDNVHEDPCDYIGLFKIGFDDLSQCLASKLLCDTRCEEDGKFIRCIFHYNELPSVKSGFHQFLYVTRDKEVCGASMPFEIKLKHRQQGEVAESSSDDEERMEDDFLLVRPLKFKSATSTDFQVESEIKPRTSNADRQTKQHNRVSVEGEEEEGKKMLHDLKLKMECEIHKENEERLLVEIENYRELEQAMIEEAKAADQTVDRLTKRNGKLQADYDILKEQYYISVDTASKYIEEIKKLKMLEKENHDLKICQHTERTKVQNEVEASRHLREENAKLLNEMENLKMQLNIKMDSIYSNEPDTRMLIDQIEDQKVMIRALENSKNLVLKELNLMLEANTKSLKSNDSEMKELQVKLDRSSENETKLLEENNSLQGKIKELTQALIAKEDALSRLSTEYEKIKMSSQTQSVNNKSAETMTCSNNTFYDSRRVEDALLILSHKVKELEQLIEFILGTTNLCEETKLASFLESKTQLLVAVSKMRKPSQVPAVPSNIPASENSVAKYSASDHASCKLCAQGFKFKDMSVASGHISPHSGQACCGSSLDSEKVTSNTNNNQGLIMKTAENVSCAESQTEIVGPVSASGSSQASLKIQKKHLCFINGTEINLEEADVATVNRLTERLSKRAPDFNIPLYELPGYANSDVDTESESSCNTGLSSKTCMKEDLLSLVNMITVLKELLKYLDDWSPWINGYNNEYDYLPKETQAELILEECKQQYQIEILLEHIEKQQENMKKVSDKICDLLARCMMWKDEVFDLKRRHDNLQAVVAENEGIVFKLKEMHAKNTAIIKYLSNEKVKWIQREASLQENVNEHAARISEAAALYRKQYIEIQRLKKKLKSVKRSKVSNMDKQKKRTFYTSSSEGNDSSYVEVLKPSKPKIGSDSDTGEHLLITFPAQESLPLSTSGCTGARPKYSFQKTCFNETFPSKSMALESSDAQLPFITVTEETTGDIDSSISIISEIPLTPTSSVAESKVAPPAKPAAKDAKSCQCVVKEVLASWADSTKDSANTEGETAIHVPCDKCLEVFSLTGEGLCSLMDHMENQHGITVCPICGQFFDANIPRKYFQYHVNDHLKD